jgi:CheY-like chemotaxis protein
MPIDMNGHSSNERRGQPFAPATSAPSPADEARAADLRRAEQRKDMFLAMLGHELRNPLAGISSAAQLLAHPAVTPEQSFRAAKIVERQVSHMVHLVNDLLDVSRVSQGQLQIDQDPVDLLEVLAGASEQADGLVSAKQHRLVLVKPQAPVWVLGDLTRLVQVVTNLLVNAARYTPAGGTIELSLSTSAQEAQIAVADNGVGIAPELAAHVFDFFVQAKRSSDRIKGGLGLGLSLVKNLVQAHGGSIALHSDGLGCGATFTVTLPLLQAGAAEAAARAEALAAAAPPPALTIALVDDNADAAKPLAMLLELSGHQPLVFPTAEALLPCIREVAPDACIIDIGLPGMDGYALARQLRSLPELAQTTLVALTGYGTETDQQRAAQAGFDRHFTKPVTFTALLAWLNEAAAARASGLQAGQGQSLPGR